MKTKARMMSSIPENHSKFPQTIPSVNPDSASPTKCTVEILEAKSEAPMTGHDNDLPARKYPSLVLFFLRTDKSPMRTIPNR